MLQLSDDDLISYQCTIVFPVVLRDTPSARYVMTSFALGFVDLFGYGTE